MPRPISPARRAAISAPAFATALTAVDDALEVVRGQRRVHRQREHSAARASRSPAGRASRRERGQPVVRDRVVHAGADAVLVRSALANPSRSSVDPRSCTGGRRARRRRRPAGVRTPVRCVDRGTRRSPAAARSSRRPCVSCTRPIAAWMSVIRLLKPTTSFSYCRSMPWLRSSRSGARSPRSRTRPCRPRRRSCSWWGRGRTSRTSPKVPTGVPCKRRAVRLRGVLEEREPVLGRRPPAGRSCRPGGRTDAPA